MWVQVASGGTKYCEGDMWVLKVCKILFCLLWAGEQQEGMKPSMDWSSSGLLIQHMGRLCQAHTWLVPPNPPRPKFSVVNSESDRNSIEGGIEVGLEAV